MAVSTWCPVESFRSPWTDFDSHGESFFFWCPWLFHGLLWTHFGVHGSFFFFLFFVFFYNPAVIAPLASIDMFLWSTGQMF